MSQVKVSSFLTCVAHIHFVYLCFDCIVVFFCRQREYSSTETQSRMWMNWMYDSHLACLCKQTKWTQAKLNERFDIIGLKPTHNQRRSLFWYFYFVVDFLCSFLMLLLLLSTVSTTMKTKKDLKWTTDYTAPCDWIIYAIGYFKWTRKIVTFEKAIFTCSEKKERKEFMIF